MYIHKHNVCQHYQMKHQLNFILHLTEMLLHILYFFLKRKEEKSGVMWTRLCPLILKCSILSTVHKLQHTHTHTHTHSMSFTNCEHILFKKKTISSPILVHHTACSHGVRRDGSQSVPCKWAAKHTYEQHTFTISDG